MEEHRNELRSVQLPFVVVLHQTIADVVNVHNHGAGLGVQVPEAAHVITNILAAIPT